MPSAITKSYSSAGSARTGLPPVLMKPEVIVVLPSPIPLALRSISTTFEPVRAAMIAAVEPARPAPTTKTSHSRLPNRAAPTCCARASSLPRSGSSPAATVALPARRARRFKSVRRLMRPCAKSSQRSLIVSFSLIIVCPSRQCQRHELGRMLGPSDGHDDILPAVVQIRHRRAVRTGTQIDLPKLVGRSPCPTP